MVEIRDTASPSNNSTPASNGHNVSPVTDTELPADPGQVIFHGQRGSGELVCNFLVGATIGNQSDDL